MFTSLHELATAAHSLYAAQDRVAFRNAHKTRFALYSGEFYDTLMERIKLRCSMTYDQFDPIWFDVYRKTVDARAGRFYAEEPVRTLIDAAGNPAAPDLQVKVAALLEEWHFSSLMDKCARFIESHRTVAIAARWRDNEMAFDVLPPSNFDVLTGPPDRRSLQDVYAFIEIADGKATVWSGPKQAEKAGYAAAWFDLTSKGEIAKGAEGVNPYMVPASPEKPAHTVLPFTVLRYEAPNGDFFLCGGDDLTRASLHAAFTVTEDAFIERFQGFGQPVFEGMEKGEAANMVISPAKAIGLSDGQKFSFVAPPNNSNERYNALERFLSLFAASKDLPADIYVPSKQPESGISRRVTQAALNDYRADFAAMMAEHEEKVFCMARAVYNTHVAPVDRIPWDYELRTILAPSEPFIDPTERDARNTTRVALGLDTVPHILARERRISLDAAIAIVRENLALTASLKPLQVAPDAQAPTDALSAATAEIQAITATSEATPSNVAQASVDAVTARANRGRENPIEPPVIE